MKNFRQKIINYRKNKLLLVFTILMLIIGAIFISNYFLGAQFLATPNGIAVIDISTNMDNADQTLSVSVTITNPYYATSMERAYIKHVTVVVSDIYGIFGVSMTEYDSDMPTSTTEHFYEEFDTWHYDDDYVAEDGRYSVNVVVTTQGVFCSGDKNIVNAFVVVRPEPPNGDGFDISGSPYWLILISIIPLVLYKRRKKERGL